MHGIDLTMAAGAGFALVALAVVALFVRSAARTEVPETVEAELHTAAEAA